MEGRNIYEDRTTGSISTIMPLGTHGDLIRTRLMIRFRNMVI